MNEGATRVISLVIEHPIRQGVQEGHFAVKVGGRVYFREPMPPSAFLGEAWLVRQAPEPPPPEGYENGGKPRESAACWRFTLALELPWNRLADFIRGVLVPLHNHRARLELTMTLHGTLQAKEEDLDKIKKAVENALVGLQAQKVQGPRWEEVESQSPGGEDPEPVA